MRNGRSTGGVFQGFRKPAPPRKPPARQAKRKIMVISESVSKKSKTDTGSGQNRFFKTTFFIFSMIRVDPYQYIILGMKRGQ